MCRKYQRRCRRRAQNDTTDIARPTCRTGTGARSVLQAKKRNHPHKNNARDRANNNVPVIAMYYMYMHEMTDDMNSPILVIHDRCSEGVCAVFP